MKKVVKYTSIIILGLFASSWGYWEYLGYRFEQDPLFYYKPRKCMDLDSETPPVIDKRSGDFCPMCQSRNVANIVYGYPAKRLLFDCCDTAIIKIEEDMDEFYREFEGKERDKRIDETIRETKTATKELKPIVDEWIVLLDKLDDALTHDYNRHSVERTASYMLMKWASIVTER